MTIQTDTDDSATPQNLINVRPVVAAIKDILGTQSSFPVYGFKSIHFRNITIKDG
jgi:hypothetical protein